MRLTAEEWEAIQEHYHYRCVYCGQKASDLTIDHITPQSHGGLTSRGNIVPACRSCNSRKGNRVPLCTVQPLLDEPYDGIAMKTPHTLIRVDPYIARRLKIAASLQPHNTSMGALIKKLVDEELTRLNVATITNTLLKDRTQETPHA